MSKLLSMVMESMSTQQDVGPTAELQTEPEVSPAVVLQPIEVESDDVIDIYAEQAFASDVETAQDAQDVVDRVASAIATLESILDSVTAAHEAGGMNRHMAATVAASTEHVYQDVGIKDDLTLSVEAFDEDSKSTTELVMESITEKISLVWQKLVEMSKRIIAWIKESFSDVFGTIALNQRRAEKIGQKLRELKSDRATGVITDESICTRLYAKGIKSENVVPEYRKYAEAYLGSRLHANEQGVVVVFHILEEIKNGLGSMRDHTAWLLRGKSEQTKLKELTMNLITVYPREMYGDRNDAPADAKTSSGRSKKDFTYSTPLFLGNVGWWVKTPDSFEEINRNYQSGTFSCEPGKFENVPILSKHDIAVVLTSHKVVSDTLKENKTRIDDMQKAVNHMEELVRHYSKSWIATSEFQAIRTSAVRAVLKFYSNAGMDVYNHFIRISRQMLNLSEKSINEHLKMA